MAERKTRNKLFGLLLVVIILVSIILSFVYNKDNEADTSWAESLANADFLATEPEISSDGLNVDFIDVGQGDCTLVTCGGKSMLIDIGEADYYQIVKNYLKSKKISHLDFVIASHPHSDHIGGMYKLVEDFDVKAFIMPELSSDNIPETETYDKLIDALAKNKIPIRYAKAGKTYFLSDAEIEILGPLKGSEEINDLSVVCMLKYGKSKFLFTGDTEESEETDIIKSGADLDCDVLKVSHHGSDKSSSDEFIKLASPDVAVISVGAGNEYDHPHAEVLRRLLKNNILIYRTDKDGTLEFSVPSENSEIALP